MTVEAVVRHKEDAACQDGWLSVVLRYIRQMCFPVAGKISFLPREDIFVVSRTSDIYIYIYIYLKSKETTSESVALVASPAMSSTASMTYMVRLHQRPLYPCEHISNRIPSRSLRSTGVTFFVTSLLPNKQHLLPTILQ